MFGQAVRLGVCSYVWFFEPTSEPCPVTPDPASSHLPLAPRSRTHTASLYLLAFFVFDFEFSAHNFALYQLFVLHTLLLYTRNKIVIVIICHKYRLRLKTHFFGALKCATKRSFYKGGFYLLHTFKDTSRCMLKYIIICCLLLDTFANK